MNQGPVRTLPGLAPSELRWRIDVDVLVVEFRGRRESPAHMAGCWEAVHALADQLALRRVLAIDLMDDEPFSGARREAFIGRLAFERFEGRRWAYVARSADRVGAYEATQLDAQEAGLDIRVFASLSEAELWVRLAG